MMNESSHTVVEYTIQSNSNNRERVRKRKICLASSTIKSSLLAVPHENQCDNGLCEINHTDNVLGIPIVAQHLANLPSRPRIRKVSRINVDLPKVDIHSSTHTRLLSMSDKLEQDASPKKDLKKMHRESPNGIKDGNPDKPETSKELSSDLNNHLMNAGGIMRIKKSTSTHKGPYTTEKHPAMRKSTRIVMEMKPSRTEISNEPKISEHELLSTKRYFKRKRKIANSKLNSVDPEEHSNESSLNSSPMIKKSAPKISLNKFQVSSPNKAIFNEANMRVPPPSPAVSASGSATSIVNIQNYSRKSIREYMIQKKKERALTGQNQVDFELKRKQIIAERQKQLSEFRFKQRKLIKDMKTAGPLLSKSDKMKESESFKEEGKNGLEIVNADENIEMHIFGHQKDRRNVPNELNKEVVSLNTTEVNPADANTPSHETSAKEKKVEKLMDQVLDIQRRIELFFERKGYSKDGKSNLQKNGKNVSTDKILLPENLNIDRNVKEENLCNPSHFNVDTLGTEHAINQKISETKYNFCDIETNPKPCVNEVVNESKDEKVSNEDMCVSTTLEDRHSKPMVEEQIPSELIKLEKSLRKAENETLLSSFDMFLGNKEFDPFSIGYLFERKMAEQSAFQLSRDIENRHQSLDKMQANFERALKESKNVNEKLILLKENRLQLNEEDDAEESIKVVKQMNMMGPVSSKNFNENADNTEMFSFISLDDKITKEIQKLETLFDAEISLTKLSQSITDIKNTQIQEGERQKCASSVIQMDHPHPQVPSEVMTSEKKARAIQSTESHYTVHDVFTDDFSNGDSSSLISEDIHDNNYDHNKENKEMKKDSEDDDDESEEYLWKQGFNDKSSEFIDFYLEKERARFRDSEALIRLKKRTLKDQIKCEIAYLREQRRQLMRSGAQQKIINLNLDMERSIKLRYATEKAELDRKLQKNLNILQMRQKILKGKNVRYLRDESVQKDGTRLSIDEGSTEKFVSKGTINETRNESPTGHKDNSRSEKAPLLKLLSPHTREQDDKENQIQLSESDISQSCSVSSSSTAEFLAKLVMMSDNLVPEKRILQSKKKKIELQRKLAEKLLERRAEAKSLEIQVANEKKAMKDLMKALVDEPNPTRTENFDGEEIINELQRDDVNRSQNYNKIYKTNMISLKEKTGSLSNPVSTSSSLIQYEPDFSENLSDKIATELSSKFSDFGFKIDKDIHEDIDAKSQSMSVVCEEEYQNDFNSVSSIDSVPMAPQHNAERSSSPVGRKYNITKITKKKVPNEPSLRDIPERQKEGLHAPDLELHPLEPLQAKLKCLEQEIQKRKRIARIVLDEKKKVKTNVFQALEQKEKKMEDQLKELDHLISATKEEIEELGLTEKEILSTNDGLDVSFLVQENLHQAESAFMRLGSPKTNRVEFPSSNGAALKEAEEISFTKDYSIEEQSQLDASSITSAELIKAVEEEIYDYNDDFELETLKSKFTSSPKYSLNDDPSMDILEANQVGSSSPIALARTLSRKESAAHYFEEDNSNSLDHENVEYKSDFQSETIDINCQENNSISSFGAYEKNNETDYNMEVDSKHSSQNFDISLQTPSRMINLDQKKDDLGMMMVSEFVEEEEDIMSQKSHILDSSAVCSDIVSPMNHEFDVRCEVQQETQSEKNVVDNQQNIKNTVDLKDIPTVIIENTTVEDESKVDSAKVINSSHKVDFEYNLACQSTQTEKENVYPDIFDSEHLSSHLSTDASVDDKELEQPIHALNPLIQTELVSEKSFEEDMEEIYSQVFESEDELLSPHDLKSEPQALKVSKLEQPYNLSYPASQNGNEVSGEPTLEKQDDRALLSAEEIHQEVDQVNEDFENVVVFESETQNYNQSNESLSPHAPHQEPYQVNEENLKALSKEDDVSEPASLNEEEQHEQKNSIDLDLEEVILSERDVSEIQGTDVPSIMPTSPLEALSMTHGSFVSAQSKSENDDSRQLELTEYFDIEENTLENATTRYDIQNNLLSENEEDEEHVDDDEDIESLPVIDFEKYEQKLNNHIHHRSESEASSFTEEIELQVDQLLENLEKQSKTHDSQANLKNTQETDGLDTALALVESPSQISPENQINERQNEAQNHELPLAWDGSRDWSEEKSSTNKDKKLSVSNTNEFNCTIREQESEQQEYIVPNDGEIRIDHNPVVETLPTENLIDGEFPNDNELKEIELLVEDVLSEVSLKLTDLADDRNKRSTANQLDLDILFKQNEGGHFTEYNRKSIHGVSAEESLEKESIEVDESPETPYQTDNLQKNNGDTDLLLKTITTLTVDKDDSSKAFDAESTEGTEEKVEREIIDYEKASSVHSENVEGLHSESLVNQHSIDDELKNYSEHKQMQMNADYGDGLDERSFNDILSNNSDGPLLLTETLKPVFDVHQTMIDTYLTDHAHVCNENVGSRNELDFANEISVHSSIDFHYDDDFEEEQNEEQPILYSDHHFENSERRDTLAGNLQIQKNQSRLNPEDTFRSENSSLKDQDSLSSLGDDFYLLEVSALEISEVEDLHFKESEKMISHPFVDRVLVENIEPGSLDICKYEGADSDEKTLHRVPSISSISDILEEILGSESDDDDDEKQSVIKLSLKKKIPDERFVCLDVDDQTLEKAENDQLTLLLKNAVEEFDYLSPEELMEKLCPYFISEIPKDVENKNVLLAIAAADIKIPQKILIEVDEYGTSHAEGELSIGSRLSSNPNQLAISTENLVPRKSLDALNERMDDKRSLINRNTLLFDTLNESFAAIYEPYREYAAQQAKPFSNLIRFSLLPKPMTIEQASKNALNNMKLWACNYEKYHENIDALLLEDIKEEEKKWESIEDECMEIESKVVDLIFEDLIQELADNLN